MAESRRDFRVGCDILSLDRLTKHVDLRAAEDWVKDLLNVIAISRGLAERIGASHSRQSPIIRTANGPASQRTCAIHPHKHQPPREGRGPSHHATCADPPPTTPSSTAQSSINVCSPPHSSSNRTSTSPLVSWSTAQSKSRTGPIHSHSLPSCTPQQQPATM